MGRCDPIHGNGIIQKKLLKIGHGVYKMHSDVFCCFAGTVFMFYAQSSTK